MRRNKTFILKWNPAISSVNLEDWDFWEKNQDFLEPNWSVHEHDKVNRGDDWFMLRVGEGVTGIVGHGYFKGRPYAADDWSEKGKIRYYSDLYLRQIFPHEEPMISTEVLEEFIPEFDWRGGHSGVLIEGEAERKLLELKNKFFEEHPINGFLPERYIGVGVEKLIKGWDNYIALFDESYNDDIEDYAWTEEAFHDMVTLKTEHCYYNSTFTFTILLACQHVMPMICRKLKLIKAKLNGGEVYESYCKIWHDGHLFHVNVNEVEVICEELEFGKVSTYDLDYMSVTI